MSTAETPADTIRKAAALMRTRAEAATPGRREIIPIHDPGPFDFPVRIHASNDEPWRDIAECRATDAEHIAATSPALMLTIADQWDAIAERHHERSSPYDPPYCGYCHSNDWPCPDMADALTTARAYLGEPDPTGTR